MAEILQQNRKSRTCPICPKSKVAFSDFDSLKVHLERCQKERPFRCDHCGWGFRIKSRLTRHENSHQRRPKSVSCSECNKKFHSRDTLSKHKKVIHQVGMPISDCSYGTIISNKAKLWSNIQPFGPPFCTQSTNL